MPAPLCFVPVGLSVTARFVGTELVLIAAVTTASDATCPVCRTPSTHVHSRYLRTVADLPAHGRRVVWRVTAQRFRCRHGGCPRTVFCERLPEIRPHARATDHLVHAQRDVALAVGGEAYQLWSRPVRCGRTVTHEGLPGIEDAREDHPRRGQTRLPEALDRVIALYTPEQA